MFGHIAHFRLLSDMSIERRARMSRMLIKLSIDHVLDVVCLRVKGVLVRTGAHDVLV